MSLCLSPEELLELTEFKRSADQIRWLRERDWAYEVGASGRPKVARAEYERHMIGGQTADRRRRRQMNLAALE